MTLVPVYADGTQYVRYVVTPLSAPAYPDILETLWLNVLGLLDLILWLWILVTQIHVE